MCDDPVFDSAHAGAAHAVFVDQPDRFDELLKNFVGGLATNTGPH
jgi:hypothetical protein